MHKFLVEISKTDEKLKVEGDSGLSQILYYCYPIRKKFETPSSENQTQELNIFLIKLAFFQLEV